MTLIGFAVITYSLYVDVTAGPKADAFPGQ